jgi:hypothetical protein
MSVAHGNRRRAGGYLDRRAESASTRRPSSRPSKTRSSARRARRGPRLRCCRSRRVAAEAPGLSSPPCRTRIRADRVPLAEVERRGSLARGEDAAQFAIGEERHARRLRLLGVTLVVGLEPVVDAPAVAIPERMVPAGVLLLSVPQGDAVLHGCCEAEHRWAGDPVHLVDVTVVHDADHLLVVRAQRRQLRRGITARGKPHETNEPSRRGGASSSPLSSAVLRRQ